MTNQLVVMKDTLMNCVMAQMADLKNTDTKELGEAVDMIKDLAEAKKAITESFPIMKIEA